ncbi:permease [Gemmatirosa kalamazoonensis]|uniref:Permease n=1 Tax=Gemmatirosa kalamazoonensis TaxID=861299 RepID=W0RFN6_9BACT|nr:ABC transporter permease [Gemmatirosa kalamazoonensis]AHG88188.1 permease [Gemmatirosa kalamazoonensis]
MRLSTVRLPMLRRFWGADPARDVDEELAFHIEMRVAELVRSGVSEADAREATMRRFGSYAPVRDECESLSRERVERARRVEWWDALRRDLAVGVRGLRANPGFALVVALTLAVGIGATTAVYSVAYGVLLRPLPYRDPDALVRLWSRNLAHNLEFFSVSAPDFLAWREERGAFLRMGAFMRQREVTLSRGGRAGAPELVDAAAVMPDVFDLLGTPVALGRRFRADDARPGAAPVALLANDLWRSRFGADSAVLGADIVLDGRKVTVVGVMPPRFFVPGTPAEVWTPLSMVGASDDPGNRELRVLARLAPGMTRERAVARLNVVAAQLARATPGTRRGWDVNSRPIMEVVIGPTFGKAMRVLLGVVGFVLLVACVNAANLQLARATARRREMALRASLGASRGRLARQLVTESALLAALGAAAGVGLAAAGLALLRAVGDTTVPRLEDVKLDAPVLAVVALVALGSVVLFGLLPALHAARADAGAVLKEGARGGTEGASTARAALVVAEVALTLVLLVGAGLLGRSFVRLQRVPLGFDPAGVSVVSVRVPDGARDDSVRAAAFRAAMLEAVGRLPGVTAVAGASSVPFGGPNTGRAYARADRPATQGDSPDADYRVVTPGYFRTMGIRLVRGRDLAATDDATGPGVAVVSETLARRTWPNEDPIGRTIRFGDVVAGPVFTVVGVVGDARYMSLEQTEVRPMLYFSAAAFPRPPLTLVVRGADAASLAPAVRRAIAALDASLPAPTVQPLADLVREATTTARFAATLFGVFAATALALALIGIYGVTSYVVRLRTREMGIRAALGAPRRAMLGSVVGGAARLAVAGIAIGLLGAAWLSGALASLLFETNARDALTYATVAFLLLLVALLASLVPARRAMRADPLLALRAEN